MNELQKYIDDIKHNIEDSSKFSKSQVISPTGFIVWEESDEEYQKRLLGYGEEYLLFLNKKKQKILNKLQDEVSQLSELINEFENKMKEKE